MSKKTPVQQTFFGEHMALEAISQAGDRLEEPDRHVVLDELVKVADVIWRAQGEPKGPGGRKRWNGEVMLRVLLLKRLHHLSDEQMEYQLRDRLSFLGFAGLGLGAVVPDSRTIWLCGETLARADGAKRLFETFDRAQGLIDDRRGDGGCDDCRGAPAEEHA